MKFYEYKAHEIFRKYGIPVPRGVLATRPEEITDPPLPCVVKAQVLIGGRGKAGGIKFAKTLDEARQAARQVPYQRFSFTRHDVMHNVCNHD